MVDTIRAEHWEQFERFCDQQAVSATPLRYPYIYRGQSEDLPLVSSLGRRAIAAGMNKARTFELENHLLTFFQRQAHLFLPPAVVPIGDAWMPWTILMQHHGAPTRLLDWTTSAYVAMYFAVRNSGPSVTQARPDGVVWMCSRLQLDAVVQARFPDKQEEAERLGLGVAVPQTVHVIQPRIHSDRMAAQETIFTTSLDPLADQGVLLDNLLPNEIINTDPRVSPGSTVVNLWKFVVPFHLKIEFMRRLRARHITGATMIPGADGLGRGADEIARVGPFP